MKSHKDLDVFKKSIDFVTDIYAITKAFPNEEKYGLSSQIRRAAVSIPSNISEGAARNHKKEYIQFLYISLGSASECETQIIISENLKYLSHEKSILMQDNLNDIKNMLIGLIKYLKRT